VKIYICFLVHKHCKAIYFICVLTAMILHCKMYCIQLQQGNRRYQTSPAVCNRTAHFAADINYNTCASLMGVCKTMNASFVIPCFM